MAKQKVIRQATVENKDNIFKFDVVGYKFLVKNFTAADVLVGFNEDDEDSEKILIPAEYAQIVMTNEVPTLKLGTDTVIITPGATSTKGVEVQCLVW